ncbi:hypothetical protein J437_LFUL015472 [Ladona fulva]|uniref:Reverse transcriptase domain-containing protein n=1 Tax=Ladona fulva TaxID=123851 RepID=A0A8K0P789_LADFU|nr:hypothetical protein J437_LFUL015472 [Ladona fulva]
MLDFRIPPKLVRLVRATVVTTQFQVKVAGSLTSNFEVTQGLKQGDGLAPMLFNLALAHVIRNSGIDTSATLTNKSKQIVGYADDLNILGRSVPSTKEAFGNWETAAKDLGLTVNEHKTKFMLQSRKHRVGNGQNITIGNYNFEGVNNFTYLDSNVSSDNDETKEMRKQN